MKNITSVNNQYIKDLSLLKNKKNRILENKYIVEGYHLVEEAYKAGVLKEVLTTDEDITFDVPTILVTDAIISKLSNGYKLERIYSTDKCALQLAITEMTYINGVPHIVTISEAMELIRKYSTKDSPNFVNGILAEYKKQLEGLC